MKQQTNNSIILILAIVILLQFFFTLDAQDTTKNHCVAAQKTCNLVISGMERGAMYNVSKGLVMVEGVYFTPDYYCVWTKDRTEQEINRTDVHELCHHFVYMDREHFCEV